MGGGAARLGLGTVQFGLAYGISNARGQPTEDEVRGILDLAAESGMAVIDTASLYGSAEERLGRTMPSSAFRVVTKTPHFRDVDHIGQIQVNHLLDSFRRSLEKLQRDRVAGLLAHVVDDLLRPGGDLLWAAMEELRAEGLVERIGASLYEGAQAKELLHRFDPSLVQLPLNVLDQRMLRDGTLYRLKARGVEIHARSAFLQGLLLMEPEAVPAGIPGAGQAVTRFRAAAGGRNPLGVALGFVLSQPQVDAVIVGVASACQLREMLAECAASVPLEGAEGLACDDERLVNPNFWPKG